MEDNKNCVWTVGLTEKNGQCFFYVDHKGSKKHSVPHLSHCHGTLPFWQKYSIKVSMTAFAALVELWQKVGTAKGVITSSLCQDPGIRSPVLESSSSASPRIKQVKVKYMINSNIINEI